MKSEPARIAGATLTNPGKIWWPREKISKLDVAKFYGEISGAILPWLKGRPLTAERCPDGMSGPCFYQKNFEGGLPAGVPTVPIPSDSARRMIHYIVGGSRKTLVAMVNLGCIAVHVMNCRKDALARPDWVAFDLDPGSGKFSDAAKAGKLLRAMLDSLGLASYPKTSGSRGLHVFVPLRRGPTQEDVRAFAASVGAALAQKAPNLVTVEMSKAKRRGRVFADALRNAFGQTIVSPYSVRRRPLAPVSTPLDWSEVDPKLDPAVFNLRNFERRLARKDPWADFWKKRQGLPG
ncbi:MAG: non-homologous end-joining DNA ligase [Thermoanaerobaculia bacterium]